MGGLLEMPWSMNDGALWCPSCGDMIARDDDDHIPDECRQCGFPDPERVADYHCGPDDDDCWNCGGEGYVYDCFDGLCLNAEDGCADCMRRCDVCA